MNCPSLWTTCQNSSRLFSVMATSKVCQHCPILFVVSLVWSGQESCAEYGEVEVVADWWLIGPITISPCPSQLTWGHVWSLSPISAWLAAAPNHPHNQPQLQSATSLGLGWTRGLILAPSHQVGLWHKCPDPRRGVTLASIPPVYRQGWHSEPDIYLNSHAMMTSPLDYLMVFS